MKKIITIGGGTGSFVVLSGLKKYPVQISAVVNMTDSGGSSGRLRDELGVLPPGDARQCLVALAKADKLMRDLFNFRFSNGDLAGHSFGNIFISALEKTTGSFDAALVRIAEVLNIQGKVVPVTLEKAELCMAFDDSRILEGEDKISSCKDIQESGIKEIFLQPEINANPQALEVIKEADAIVIGPGNLYCSLIPNFLVKGISEAIRASKALKIYNVNLVTQKGHTDNFSVFDFIKEIEKYLGENVIDFIIYNREIPPKELLQKYARQGEPVLLSATGRSCAKPKTIAADLLSQKIFSQDSSDTLDRTLIRHDPDKLAEVIMQTIANLH